MLILEEYAKMKNGTLIYDGNEFWEKNEKFLKKYRFLVDETMFLEKYRKLSDIIKREYKVDYDDVSFQQRQFEKKVWNRAKERNFYMTLKILAENGSMTIKEIFQLDPFYKDEKWSSKYKTYYRLLNGEKKDNAVGLIEKKIVQRKTVKGSDSDVTYELTLFGIFLAIEFFCNVKEIMIGMDISKKSVKKSTEILDLIAKNYCHYLPMIFGKWDVVKSINYSFVLIKTIMNPEPKMRNWMRTLSEMHRFTILFNSDEKQVMGMFYYDFAYSHGVELTQQQKKELGTEIIGYIEKILEIASHKTLEEKADIKINEGHIRGMSRDELDAMYDEVEKLEKESLSFKF